MPRITALLLTSAAACYERVSLQFAGRPEVLLYGAVDEAQLIVGIHIHRPDVLLIDALSCGDRVIPIVRRVAALGFRTKTLLFGSNCTETRVTYVLHCGGAGCVPAACSPFELIRAIQAVHAGELWASRKVLASALRQSAAPTHAASLDGFQDQLSKRECEIVEWMRCGMTNKEIARKLGISDMTVKTHAHNIFQKLEVSGRLRLLGLGHPSPRASRVFVDGSGAAGGIAKMGPRGPRLKPAA